MLRSLRLSSGHESVKNTWRRSSYSTLQLKMEVEGDIYIQGKKTPIHEESNLNRLPADCHFITK